jgi:hypothetical protein
LIFLSNRRSITGYLLMLNNTPITWMSRQKTVETSTNGSELVASIIAIELIIEQYYLAYVDNLSANRQIN